MTTAGVNSLGERDFSSGDMPHFSFSAQTTGFDSIDEQIKKARHYAARPLIYSLDFRLLIPGIRSIHHGRMSFLAKTIGVTKTD